MQYHESNLVDLYNSTVAAYPKTTLRQFATDPIVITKLSWTPFKGVKTLFVRGLAQNEGAEYSPMILFREVDYNAKSNIVHVYASDGLPYEFGKVVLKENNVTLRCDCPDYLWRWHHTNAVDKSNYGRDRKKYVKIEGSTRPPVNPSELPGMCKHILKLVKVLSEAGIFLS